MRRIRELPRIGKSAGPAPVAPPFMAGPGRPRQWGSQGDPGRSPPHVENPAGWQLPAVTDTVRRTLRLATDAAPQRLRAQPGFAALLCGDLSRPDHPRLLLRLLRWLAG
jgi:hypothetical protein